MNWQYRHSELFDFKPKLTFFNNLVDTLSIKYNINFRCLGQFLWEYLQGSPYVFPWKPDAFLRFSYYDFHCHTQYSDGAPTHEQIIQFLSKANHLSGLATSDHLFHINVLNNGTHKRESNEHVIHQSYRLSDKINNAKKSGKIKREFLFIPGTVEFGIRVDPNDKSTAIELIGLGLPENFIERNGGLHAIKETPALDLIDKIHDESGLAIFVHPFYFNQGLKFPEIWKKCDAIEQFNHTNYFWADPSTLPYFQRFRAPIMIHRLFLLFLYFNWSGEAVVSQLKKFATGSSDAHILSFYGAGATAFENEYTTFDDLSSALLKGKGKPCLNPLWRPDFSEPNPIEQMYNKWGRDFNKTIERIHSKMPYANLLLKFVSLVFGIFERTHEHRRKQRFLLERNRKDKLH